jgi:hypothetical protein
MRTSSEVKYRPGAAALRGLLHERTLLGVSV